MAHWTSYLNVLPPKVILWGGTGQAKVVRPIIEFYGAKVVAVFDDTKGLPSPFPDIPIYEGQAQFLNWRAKNPGADIGFCIAIGNPHGRVRLRLHDWLEQEQGLSPITIAHQTAFIAQSATIGVGTQLMAGAIVGEEARIGRQCIVNTKASADHECVLEDGVELAPGATLCGIVHVKTNAWICAGATVLPRMSIGEDAIVGAGAVVNRSVNASIKVVGVPARPLLT